MTLITAMRYIVHRSDRKLRRSQMASTILKEKELNPMPPSIQEGDDEALYRRFIEGDDAACVILYRRHNQRLFMFCVRMVGDRAQAQDLAQESWERLIELRTTARPLENPIGFLMRMARNLCLDYLRSRRRMLSLDTVHESEHPAYSIPEQSEQEELMILFLQKLPVDYREVLVLNTYCGYSFEEIATMLGKSSEAIWTRASRARSLLRKLMGIDDESNPPHIPKDPKIGGKKQ